MQTQNHNKYQLIAYEVLKAMDASLEHENVALSAIQAIKTYTEWQTVAILVPDSHDVLYVCASIGSLPIAMHVVQQTKQTGVDQLSFSLNLEDYDHRHYCALTACIGGKTHDCLGILYASNLEANPLSENDASLAMAIADALAIGLNNAKLMRHLQEQAYQLQMA